MIIEQGRVLSANADWAEVEAGGSSCGSCGTASSCGVTQEGKPGRHGRMVLRVANTVGARAGDIVDLSVKSEAMSTALAVVYGLPMLGLVLGMIMGHGVGSTAGDALGALLGALAGFLGARLAAGRIPSGVRLLAIASNRPAAPQPIYFQTALFKE